ncbi:hypothetical protein KUCAC02_013915 [Chaenocephalus aceratus]|uniref:Uncharacterized protein n=1 Tax=Chaenocephalus aceratus TaxID=36190 RepID=A0ACB9WDN5_CHAAC|nr:hypothetical protein KUCAC02_013915 [Chaenocephalus aceratus]
MQFETLRQFCSSVLSHFNGAFSAPQNILQTELFEQALSNIGKQSPSASRDPNQKYDQGEGGDHSQYAPTDGGMPRSPSDYGDGDPRRAPRGPHMYPDADAARTGYRDRRGPGRWHSQEYPLDQELDGPSEYDLQRQRQEEFQTRYRSDPNLARYPVKPQPYEEQMRMHAEVGRMRHERRHSDVSLAYTEQDDPGPVRLSRQHLTERRPPMVGQRSYSVDRSSPGPMGGSLGGHRSSNHSPPTPHRSPVLGDRSGDLRRGDMDSMRRQQHHLDPSSAVRKTKREKMESMLRNDSLSSDQSESVRPPPPKPHKTKKGGKMRQVSLSSSEEELATTPEYTSCEDVEIESESVSEKGDLDGHWWDHASWHSSEASPMSLHPVTWQPSKDGDRLIGRILLNKRMKDGSVPRDSGALLGLKVVGGKMTESGGAGVSRPIGDIPRIPDSTHAQLESSSSSFESQKVDRPSISVTSPMSPSMLRDAPSTCQVSSQAKALVEEQRLLPLGSRSNYDLPPREDGRPRNPYVKIYFLPDRSDKSKRRTKTVKKSLEPKWNQTFMYSPVHRREFRERMLEITLWDQARVREEESEFLGEILIELETALLDDEPHWYKLQTHDVSSMPLPRASPNTQRRQLHGESPTRRLQNKGSYSYNSGKGPLLSQALCSVEYLSVFLSLTLALLPFSSTKRSQRISDSEISDYDCEDGVGVITDYRSNGRDFQSSTLSVPDQVMSSNHCSHSADINRARSRSPSVPPPSSRSLDPAFDLRPSQYSSSTRVDHHSVSEDNYSPDRAHPRSGSVQTSPNSTPMSSRRGRQLPQLPPTGKERNGAGEECVAPQPQNGGPAADCEEKPQGPPVNGRKGKSSEQCDGVTLLCRLNSCVTFTSICEVTWEDQQRGLNGCLSDGGAQPHPSLTDPGWYGHGGEDPADEAEDEQVQAGSGAPTPDWSRITTSAQAEIPGAQNNLSAKVVGQRVSDVSAVSRTSSASRFSSTSYMSGPIRKAARRKPQNPVDTGEEHQEDLVETEEDLHQRSISETDLR